MPACSCGMDHEQVRDACRNSLFATARILCGYRKGQHYRKEPSRTYHEPLLKLRQSWIAGGAKRVLTMWPRKHLKTSLMTIADVVHKLIRNPNERILLVHASGDRAQRWVRAIEDILDAGDEFRSFAHYFPELVPNRRKTEWSSKAFTIERSGKYPQPSCEGLGLNSTIVGGAYTNIKLDDLVERKISDSPLMMQQALSFLDDAPRLLDDMENDVIEVTGTLWPGGYYEKLMASPMWKKMILGCYHDNRSAVYFPDGKPGLPVWKEGFTKGGLERVRAEMGEYEFAHQMLNLLIERGLQRFDSSDILYYLIDPDADRIVFRDDRNQQWAVRVKQLDIRMAIDPSTGTGNDDSAIVVVGWDAEHSLIFVLEAWAGRVLLPSLVNKALEIYARWKPRMCYVESYATQAVYRQAIRDEAIRRGVSISLQGITHGALSKNAAITDRDGLLPYFKRHQVYVGKQHADLVQQLLNYVPGKFDQRDDMIDALCYLKTGWKSRGIDFASKGGDSDVPELNEELSVFAAPRDDAAYGLRCQT